MKDSVEVAETDLLDSLPGISIRSALERTRGNKALLKNILCGFAKNYAESAAEIREALDKGDLESARNLAHAIKGLAGNISADGLYTSALHLEAALKERNMEESERRFHAFEDALAEVLHSLNTLMPEPHEIESGAKGMQARAEPPDPERVARHMKELEALLQASSIDAVEFVMSIKQDLSFACSPEDVQALEEAVEEIDFETALSLLTGMAQKLGVGL